MPPSSATMTAIPARPCQRHPVWLCLVAACLLTPTGALADRLLRAADGAEVTRAELVAELVGADFVLLGELHDNPAHHDRRAELLSELTGRIGAVVVEHLDRGTRLDAAAPLDGALDAAGYRKTAWRWPIQRRLFESARAAAPAVVGGNLSRADGRRVAMDGAGALDARLDALITNAPLDDDIRARLDRDLVAGHCGQLDDTRLPNMRLAQRGRDAALAHALLAEANRPAVLLAGNGHVRRDYGVPSLLARAVSDARVVSVGFLETDQASGTWPDMPRAAFDYLWITAPATRPDPCANLRMPPLTPARVDSGTTIN